MIPPVRSRAVIRSYGIVENSGEQALRNVTPRRNGLGAGHITELAIQPFGNDRQPLTFSHDLHGRVLPRRFPTPRRPPDQAHQAAQVRFRCG